MDGRFPLPEEVEGPSNVVGAPKSSSSSRVSCEIAVVPPSSPVACPKSSSIDEAAITEFAELSSSGPEYKPLSFKSP